MPGWVWETMWNMAQGAATTVVGVLVGSLIGWDVCKRYIEGIVESHRKAITVFLILIMAGLLGGLLQQTREEEPETLVELSPVQSAFKPQLGYYWVCAGDVTITNNLTEATIKSQDFVSQLPSVTPAVTGVVTTLNFVDLPENIGAIDLTVSTSGLAGCWSTTDENRPYIEASVNQLVENAPNFICGKSPCEKYVPYYPKIADLLWGESTSNIATYEPTF